MTDARAAKGLAAHQERKDRSVPRSRGAWWRRLDRQARPRACRAPVPELRVSSVLSRRICLCGNRDADLALDVPVRNAARRPICRRRLACTRDDLRLSRRSHGRLHPDGHAQLDRAAAAQRRATGRCSCLMDRRPRRLFDGQRADRGAGSRSSFPEVLSAAIWREVMAGRNWRNAPVALLLTLFASANLLHHLGAFWPAISGVAVRLALGVAALLIALVGGRSFRASRAIGW